MKSYIPKNQEGKTEQNSKNKDMQLSESTINKTQADLVQKTTVEGINWHNKYKELLEKCENLSEKYEIAVQKNYLF